MKRLPFAVLFAPLFAIAIACGGSTSGSTPQDDAGTSTTDSGHPTGDASTTDAGTDLFPADATKIVVTEKGGFGPSPPDGSVCFISDVTYTLVFASRELSWNICEAPDGGPFAFRTGQATLSEADFATVSATLHALTRTTDTQCGADKPSGQIVFTTPAGEITYYDDFYFCDPKDTKIYVSGIDAVLAALGKLAK
jgi:hypothetical protein